MKIKLVNFILRACFGLVLIEVLNSLIFEPGFGISVGLNAVTAGTAGIFGLWGIIVLYGLILCVYR